MALSDVSATNDEIKKAFKSKAREVHPDRNPAPAATRQCQFISEAYQALGDPDSRAKYDANSYKSVEPSPSAERSLDLIVCSICHRITALPRYVISRGVISAVLITWRVVNRGVFCSATSDGKDSPLWRAGSRTGLAPLKVMTAPGSSNYYVKVVDWETHAAKADFLCALRRDGL